MRDHREWDPEIASAIVKAEAARPGAAPPLLDGEPIGRIGVDAIERALDGARP